MKIVSFTGTREGMTPKQKEAVSHLLQCLSPDQVHHGCCVGSDSDFHSIALELGIDVVGHPGCNNKGDSPLRADLSDFVEVYDAEPYLVRNKAMVLISDALIATPKSTELGGRGGTLSTIRFAAERDKDMFVVFPDGSVIKDLETKQQIVI